MNKKSGGKRKKPLGTRRGLIKKEVRAKRILVQEVVAERFLVSDGGPVEEGREGP